MQEHSLPRSPKKTRNISDMTIMNQKYYPEYKDLTFKSEKEFYNWLKEKAARKIHFKDYGQDCLYWWIDEGGEVIHSDLQSAIWNGMIVDLSRLEVGKNIGVMETEKQQTRFYDFVVEKIETLKTVEEAEKV